MFVRRFAMLFSILSLIAAPASGARPMVNESARDIPVAYEVDVAVVGGGTGAAAAAIAAAGSGAKVFLAAPHPYLGDDVTATLRLWLEEGEVPGSPLAKLIFNDAKSAAGRPDPNRVAISYETDRPSDGVHKDTSPPKNLADGIWGAAATQSVQYGGDVNVTADLKQPQDIREVRLVVYHRANGEDGTNFKVASVTIFAGDDKTTWKELGTLKNPQLQRDKAGQPATPDAALTLSLPVAAKARYVKLAIKKTDDVERILLGEVEIIQASSSPAPKPPVRPPMPRPMHVKITLDAALLAAGVDFLYSCYATDVLRDADGKPCGIVMANRAGRQAVIAKTIIDATDRATVARMAGVRFKPYPAGVRAMQRTVIGGEVAEGKGISARVIDPPFTGAHPNRAKTSSGTFKVIEYTLQLPINDDRYASLAAAEQQARTMTYDAQQQFTSDVLFQIPPVANPR